MALAARATDAAWDVLTRLSHEQVLQEAIEVTAQQTQFPNAAGWEQHGLAQGHAGLALAAAHAHRCFPDETWDLVAHRQLALAAAAGTRRPLGPGLFSGLAGLAFVARYLARGDRYRRFSRTVRTQLDQATRELAARVTRQPGDVAVSDYDVVSGLSGIATVSRVALDALIVLTEPTDDEVPRLATAPDRHVTATLRAEFPQGSVNLGLAHGLPGPLSALASAATSGEVTERLATSIRFASDWLVRHRADDAWGVNWPAITPLPLDRGTAAPARAAWCYGAPGVARALWLAGAALRDRPQQRLAEEAIVAVLRRPDSVRQVESPTICHGLAGLLLVVLRFWHDTGDEVFRAAAVELTEQLLDAYEPGATLLGFQSVEPGGVPVDQPGLLDGAAGTALVLLAASRPVSPEWDQAFALS